MKKLASLFAFLIFIACSNSNNRETVQNIDVKVVENSEPKYDGQFWEISTEPKLVMGVKEGEAAYQFYRVYDAVKLDNGNIWVSNSGSSEIRVFDENGKFITSFGGLGKGPGEFAKWGSMRMYRLGESKIGINDSGNERINIYDLNGVLLNTIIVRPLDGAGNPTITGAFTNGDFFIWSTVGSAALRGKPGSLIKKEYGFYRLTPDGEYSDRLFTIPARPRYINEFGGRTHFPFIPLSPEPQYTTDSKNGVLYAPGNTAKNIRFDSAGIKSAIYKWHIPSTKVSEIWERYKEEFYIEPLSGSNRLKRYIDFLNEDLPLPEKTPSIVSLKVDRLGYIWVELFELPWQNNSTWHILTAEGQWLGALDLPDNFSITDIGKNYLLGYRYKDGIQQIVLYSLTR